MKSKIIVFADRAVGEACTEWLLSNYKQDISLIVTTADNRIRDLALAHSIPTLIYTSEEELLNHVSLSSLEFDIGILLWWPNIIHEPLISLPCRGFVNTHPSLLPYNRGKHPNFWSIVTETPFGVTLHKVDSGIDTGMILAQQVIPISWTDTGESLYQKSLQAMFVLFVDFYPKLRFGTYNTIEQPKDSGSSHKADEITEASKISLDKTTTARELLNRLRARTFSGYPACSFTDDGIDYEVTLRIQRK